MRGQVSSFPDVYAEVPLATLLAAYRAGPARARKSVAGLDLAALRARPRTGKWSILETVGHLADSEVIGAGRMRLALAQPGSAVFGYDQVRWAQELRHNEGGLEDLEGALQVLDAVRGWMSPVLERANAAEWRQTVLHPEHGPVTVRNLLELYADHIERHVEQILECRRLLGRPLALPAVLPRRLY